LFLHGQLRLYPYGQLRSIPKGVDPARLCPSTAAAKSYCSRRLDADMTK
jgi:hypothetical protein